MASESGSTGKSVVLLKYLDSAWQNSQHHESSRMTLIRLYFFFALAVFIALLLFSTSLRSEIAMFCLPLFLTTYGLSVIRTSIRYKERILRDIRTIYRIHDFLLSSDDQLKEIKSIYYGYRKQEKKKKTGETGFHDQVHHYLHYFPVIDLVFNVVRALYRCA